MMKKGWTFFAAFLLVLSLAGCGLPDGVKQEHKVIVDTEKTLTYYEMTDGTWQYDGETYQYCLHLPGYLPNTDLGIEYVVLTDDADLDFETVSKSTYSSRMEDIQRMNRSAVVDRLYLHD